MTSRQVRRRVAPGTVRIIVGVNTAQLSGLTDAAARLLLRHSGVPHQQDQQGRWVCPARDAGQVGAVAQRLGHRVILAATSTAPQPAPVEAGLW
jgi:hypothetical protein